VLTERPRCVMVCPPCGLFSIMQNATPGPWSEVRMRSFAEGMILLIFCMEVANVQASRGLYSIFEHPLTSLAWQLEVARTVAALPVVQRIRSHPCMLGHRSTEGIPVRRSNGVNKNRSTSR